MKTLFALLIGLFFSFISEGHHIQYIHKDITQNNISSDTIIWKEIKEPIYNGLDNGIYWFKITLSAKEQRQVISLPWGHLSQANLYYENKEVKPMKKKRFIAFKAPDSGSQRIVYLKVNCTKEAIIPIRIESQDSYLEYTSNESLIIGIYNGFVFAAILFNLMSFYTYREKIYLYYTWILISLSMGILYRDGSFHYWFFGTQFLEHAELIISILIGYGGMLLCVSYMQLDIRLPKLKKYGHALLLVSILLFGYTYVTNDFLVMSINYILILIVLLIFWGSAVYLFKESADAKFVAIAYGLLLSLAVDHFIFPHFGVHSLEVPLIQFRIGGFFEVTVFTFAISYRGLRMAREIKAMRTKIEEYSIKLNIAYEKQQTFTDPITYFISEFNLTHKEVEIFEGIALGKLNKEIANEMHISINTVKFHIRNIYEKLEVKSRKEAVHKYHSKS